MPPKTSRRLSRDVILDAALTISRASEDGFGESPTGQAIGRHLGVDRSAIWRHFSDKDDLLLAIADALSAETVDALDGVEDPVETLRVVWRSVMATFMRYPAIGCQVGERFVAGPNALTVIERVLAALASLGFGADEAAVYYRAFIDLTLACASTRARYLLLSQEQRQADQARTEVAVRWLGRPESALAAVDFEKLARVDEAKVDDLAIDTLIAGILRRRPGGS